MPEAVALFLRRQRGATFASLVLLDQISRAHEKRIQAFVRQHQVPLHRFTKCERKNDVMQRHLADFTLPEVDCPNLATCVLALTLARLSADFGRFPPADLPPPAR